MTRQLFFLVISLFSTLAFAGAAEPVDDSAVFRTLAMDVPNRLMRMGIHQIGPINLDTLDRRFSAIRVRPFDNSIGWFMGSGDANRTSALFIMDKKLIIVQMGDWLETPQLVRPVLALHEELNAIDYDDEDYQVSVAMWRLSLEVDPSKLRAAISGEMGRPIRQVKIRQKPPEYHMKEKMIPAGFGRNGEVEVAAAGGGGGATGIGGGGDVTSIELKMGMIDRVYNLVDYPDQEKLESIVLNLKVESDPYDDMGVTPFKILENPYSVVMNKTHWTHASTEYKDANVEVVLALISRLNKLRPTMP